jgi:hypothetical protein
MCSVEHFTKCSSFPSSFTKLLQFSEGVELENECTRRDPIVEGSRVCLLVLNPISVEFIRSSTSVFVMSRVHASVSNRLDD